MEWFVKYHDVHFDYLNFIALELLRSARSSGFLMYLLEVFKFLSQGVKLIFTSYIIQKQ